MAYWDKAKFESMPVRFLPLRILSGEPIKPPLTEYYRVIGVAESAAVEAIACPSARFPSVA